MAEELKTAFNPADHFIQLQGKDYLQVMWRLVWFREEKPLWCINTELVSHDKEKQIAIFRAVISDDKGYTKSTGYGSESARDFRDYLEKAETKAVGRALAMLGYGTQFAPELDEGDRIVDSPVPKKQNNVIPMNDQSGGKNCSGCGAEISDKVHSYSMQKFGRPLCMECQKNGR